MQNTDGLWETVTFILIAAAGGIVRLLSARIEEHLSFNKIFAEMFCSAFVGLIVVFVAKASGLTGYWIGALAGIGGWIGPNALNALLKISKISGVNLKVDKEPENKNND